MTLSITILSSYRSVNATWPSFTVRRGCESPAPRMLTYTSRYRKHFPQLYESLLTGDRKKIDLRIFLSWLECLFFFPGYATRANCKIRCYRSTSLTLAMRVCIRRKRWSPMFEKRSARFAARKPPPSRCAPFSISNLIVAGRRDAGRIAHSIEWR